MITPKTLLSTLGVAGCAILSACATAQKPNEASNLATPADAHKIVVVQAAERFEVPVSAYEEALTEATRSQIAAFGRGYTRGGHGALVLSAPSGGDNADAASRIAHAVRLHLAVSGVPFSAIAGSTYDASGMTNAPILLSYTRFDAQAPECAPLWRQDLSDVSLNKPWKSFGCTQQANLAAMIADPADLLGPRAEDPRDSARRANTLEAYRKGQQSHATRSNDERVTVSNAVE
jgi:pilus assembly protein CpaD